MTRKENVIKEEAKPVDELPNRPYGIEQCQKDDPFSSKAGFGVICGEK
jgi:hypothetical protein